MSKRAMLLALAATACGSKREAPPVRHDAAPAKPVTVIDAARAVDAAVAIAPPDAPTIRPSARCQGLPRAAEVDVLSSHDGVQAFHVHHQDDRWLVFDGPKACHVTPVKKADGRVHGAFWPGRGDVKAFVLAGEPCEVDEDEHLIGCVGVVGVREEGGAMIDAIETCTGSRPPNLHAASIFADQDSLLVSCTDLNGWGISEELVLLHVLDGKLKIVLRVEGGWGDDGPSDECVACKQYCWASLDRARWRVLERGAAPVLETLTPLAYPSTTGTDDEQTAYDRARRKAKNQVQWTFDPAQGVFVAGERHHVNTDAIEDACAPHPMGSPLPQP